MIVHEVKFLPICCEECGVLFAILDSHFSLIRVTGKDVHCPNGHANAWVKDVSIAESLTACRAEITKLKSEMVEYRRRAEFAEAEATDAQRRLKGGTA